MPGKTYQAPRGTSDLLPPDSERWARVEAAARRLFRLYGFREIRTPIFEARELFERGIGETTDIVEKQMYVFQDRGGDWLALRPEGTASVLRAFVEHRLDQTAPPPYRYFYIGPMFRHERPQRGRYRQFHQIGVEALGESAPEVDAEVIALGWAFLRHVGARDVRVELNSIGCSACRPAYQAALRAYWQTHADELCLDCRRRMDRNPLRVLDCKNEACQAVLQGAPVIDAYWCDPCRTHFEAVRAALAVLDVPYVRNARLVRGLDYYMRTAFEMTAEGLGAQNAVLGGGRYDGLLQALGGPDWPGVGFAIGMERLMAILPEAADSTPALAVMFLPLTEAARGVALRGVQAVRRLGVSAWARMDVGSVKSGLRGAHRAGVRFAVIIGDDELRAGRWTVRDMQASRQETLSPEEAVEVIRRALLETPVPGT
jgi:histidyl-tRNA synthetase